jgi:hypothetical protein
MLADLNGALHWVARLKAIAPDTGVHNTAIYSRSATMRFNLIRIPIFPLKQLRIAILWSDFAASY